MKDAKPEYSPAELPISWPHPRRWSRLRLDVPIRIFADLWIVNGRASDLSAGGVTILCERELGKNEAVAIEFVHLLSRAGITIKGVVRNRSEDIYGIEFVRDVDADNADLAALREQLEILQCPL